MRRVIQHGWQKAQSYDLTPECCVRSYIDLMCLLGGEFDIDLLLPWAAEILIDRSSSDQVARGDRLYHRSWVYIINIIPDYRDADGKPTTARFVSEMRKLRDLPDDFLTADATPDFSRKLAQWIEWMFPAKYRYVGEQAVSQLILTGKATAAGYGITGVRGITVVIMFMFVIGRGFVDDPLAPWASTTLNDMNIADSNRGDALYKQGVGFLRRWWDSAPAQER